MKTIEKKIFPEYFQEVWNGNKNFEIRKDEDDIQIGDRLLLREWNGVEYTGSGVCKTVKYVLRNCPSYGLMEGFCIISW